ncbi:MAG: AAA family ATPase [Polyangiaceae bacterium]
MITKFFANGYRCLKNVELSLTPLHAVIGPNDSGKSTILRGIEAAVGFATHEPFAFDDPGDPAAQPWLQLSTSDGDPAEVGFAVVGFRYDVRRLPTGFVAERVSVGNDVKQFERPVYEKSLVKRSLGKQAPSFVPRTVRLLPTLMRAESPLVTEAQLLEMPRRGGEHLAGVLQALQGRGDEAYNRVRDAMLEKFHTLKSIGVAATSPSKLELRAQLRDGTKVAAANLSEGFLYYLAFNVLREIATSSIFLIEEPENGLHPSRVRDVIAILRSITEAGCQIVLATHSPLVINELRPEEVTVVARPSTELGTLVTPIKKTPLFGARGHDMPLGDLWLRHADADARTDV